MGITPWLLAQAARHLFLPYIHIRPYLTRDPSQLKRVLEDQCKTDEERAQIRDMSGNTNVDDVVASLLETFKHGPDGPLQDGTVLCRDWGFDLEDVNSERVWLVHGDQDVQAPLRVVQWIDERLGGGRLKVLKETHYTIWKEHSEDIFRQSAEA
jgi:hypothetical protein